MRFSMPLLLTLGLHPTFAAAKAPTLMVKDFCAAFESAAHEQRWAACRGPERHHPEVAKAHDAAERARHQCIELINSGASQKRLRFDGAAAARCLTSYQTWLADPSRSHAAAVAMRTACAGVVTGTQLSQGACESTLDCATPTAVCLGAHGGPPGTCRDPLDGNVSCDDEQLGSSAFYAAATVGRGVCGPGHHCGVSKQTLRCLANAEPGAACAANDPGACGTGWRCGGGHCVQETRSVLHQACSQHGDCAMGLYCQAGACKLRQNSGAACGSSDECQGTCQAGHCQSLCGSG